MDFLYKLLLEGSFVFKVAVKVDNKTIKGIFLFFFAFSKISHLNDNLSKLNENLSVVFTPVRSTR